MAGLKIALLLLGVAATVSGYSMGPPKERCKDMKPGHGDEGNIDLSLTPFTITLNSTTYKHKQPVAITIDAEEFFEGIMMQVRKTTGDLETPLETTPVGWFAVPDQAKIPGTKVMECASKMDTVAHNSSAHKPSGSTFIWHPPKDQSGNVQVVATIVRTYNKYYVQQKSTVLEPASDYEEGPEAWYPRLSYANKNAYGVTVLLSSFIAALCATIVL